MLFPLLLLETLSISPLMRLSTLSQQLITLNEAALFCSSVDDINNLCVLSHFDFIPTSLHSNEYATVAYNEHRIAIKFINKAHTTIDNNTISNIIKCIFHPLDPSLLIVLQENGISFIKHTDLIEFYKFKSINDPDLIPVDLFIHKHIIFILRQNGQLLSLPYLPFNCTLTHAEFKVVCQSIDIDNDIAKYKKRIGHDVTLIRDKISKLNLQTPCLGHIEDLPNAPADTTTGIIKHLDDHTFAFFRANCNATIDLFIIQHNKAILLQHVKLFDDVQTTTTTPIKLLADPIFDDMIYAGADGVLFAIYAPSLSAIEINIQVNPTLIQLITTNIDDFVLIKQPQQVSLIASSNDDLQLFKKPIYLDQPMIETGLQQCPLIEPFYAYETSSRLTFTTDAAISQDIQWEHLIANAATVQRMNDMTSKLRQEISILMTCQSDITARLNLQAIVHQSLQHKALEITQKDATFQKELQHLEARILACKSRQETILRKNRCILVNYYVSWLQQHKEEPLIQVKPWEDAITTALGNYNKTMYAVLNKRPTLNENEFEQQMQMERWEKAVMDIGIKINAIRLLQDTQHNELDAFNQ